MRAKPGFNLREVCGEQIIVAEGEENIDFSNIISMNESAAYLWKNIQEREFTVEDLTKLLLQAYEVTETVARKDAETLVAQWAKAGIITGDDIPQIDVKFAPIGSQKKETVTETQPEKKGFLGKLFKK